MIKAAAFAVLLAAAPAAARPLPNDSFRGEHDFTPPPPPPTADVGRLNQLLPQKEPETFVGLWVDPRGGLVVAFTRNAAATLAKYTKDPKFTPLDRPGPSARELYRTQEQLMTALQRLGARPVGAGVNVMQSRVEIEVVGDMTRARQAIAAGDLKLPPYVTIAEPKPLAYPDPPPPPPGFVNPVKAFPRVTYRAGGIELAVLRMGDTVLEDGCLKLKGERRNVVIVWPNEARPDLSHGDLRVFDRMSGESIRIGERIILGGSSHELKDDTDLVDANPACPGPYIHLTSFRPAAPFEAEMREREIKERAARDHISEAEARRRIGQESERETRLKAAAEQIRLQRPDLFGALYTGEGKGQLLLAGDLPLGLLPADLAPFVEVRRVPRPIAALDAERGAILDQIEALGLEGVSAGSDIEAGRVTLNIGDNAAEVAEAIRAGRLAIPADVQVMTNGAPPAGAYSEWNMEAAWKALEAAPDFAQVQALVAATPIPFYGEAPRKPSAQGAKDIARWLVMLGFTADEITRLRAVGIDPVIDWEAQNGRATLENRAALAEQVAVGEVLDLDPHALLGDGARTTVRFRIIEALKGTAKAGDTVAVRLESGFDPDGKLAQSNGDPMLLEGLPGALKPGDRYVLFLSSGQYANTARHAGGKPRPGFYALRQEMSRVLEGETLARTYAEQAPAPTLDDLRRRIAPVQAKFEKAGVN